MEYVDTDSKVLRLQQERDELFLTLHQLVHGDVGHHTLWTLSEGQGTDTHDGRAWLAAQALVRRLQAANIPQPQPAG